MAYEFFYEGSPYSLEPTYGNFAGYHIPAVQIGATTSIQTANQIKEVTNLLNQGIKQIEVGSVNPEVFDMIPKQHLKEINRLSKLTSSDTSVHAPVIDPSGFTQQGWNEANREIAERQFTDIVERSHELSPEGNIPVTIHASAVPGTEHIEIDGKEYDQRMVAVNRETGEFIPLIREKRFYPRKPEGKVYESKEELDIANISYWDRQLSQLIFYKERGDEILQNNEFLINNLSKDIEEGRVKKGVLTPTQQQGYNAVQNVRVYLDNTQQNINSLFNQAWKFSNEKTKEELRKAAEKYQKGIKAAQNLSDQSNAIQNLINTMQVITSPDLRTGKIDLVPQVYEPVEKFTKEKASQTLGGVAFNAYKKFGNNSPIVSIENPPYGSALARAQDLKDVIQMTRERFVEKAREQGMSEGEARNAAKKLIGATWDTSHISMMRKQGFKPEKLVEEAKTIAPFVKHVHLNDNFGSTHTDLPPGMANIPVKDILQEFEKAGVKAKKIFEGGNFFQHFQTSPHPFVLEALGSPIYSAMAQPYWNQMTSTYGSYFSTYNPYFPEQHFSWYGSGFSGMPTELGGQFPGKQSRFAGTPQA